MSIQAYTTEQKELHESLSASVWDLYKDAHGFKPRSMNFDAMSIEELESLINSLQEDLERNEAFEAEMNAIALKDFENAITNVMEVCNCSRYVAINYLIDAEDGADNLEHFFWSQDIGFPNVYKFMKEYREYSLKIAA